MKQSVQDMGTQTDDRNNERSDDENATSQTWVDDETALSEDWLLEDAPVTKDKEEETDVRFIRIKTETKQKDVLYEMPALEMHFIRHSAVSRWLSEYDGKYLSLSKLEQFLSEKKTGDRNLLWEESGYTAKEREEAEDRLTFLYKALSRGNPRFSHVLKVCQEYEMTESGSGFSPCFYGHDFSRKTTFCCKEIQ